MKDFYLYIIECNDGSYYTGHTDNLELRISQHLNNTYKCYTNNKHPLKVVFAQAFASRYEALAMERRIKLWTRKKKKALIDGNWDLLCLLAKKNFKKNKE